MITRPPPGRQPGGVSFDGQDRIGAQLPLALQAAGGGSYISLDDRQVSAAALEDPVGLLSGLAAPVVIDEIQRAGEPLVQAVKQSVDRSRAPGQFLLTGSADFLTVPTISESLAGRAVLFRCTPSRRARSKAAAMFFWRGWRETPMHRRPGRIPIWRRGTIWSVSVSAVTRGCSTSRRGPAAPGSVPTRTPLPCAISRL